MNGNDRPPLSDKQAEDLVAFLADEADPNTVEEMEKLVATDPTISREAKLLQESWRMLEVLDRPKAPDSFREKTTTAALSGVSESLRRANAKPLLPLILYTFIVVVFVGSLSAARFWPTDETEMLKNLEVLQKYDALKASGDVAFLHKVRTGGLLDNQRRPERQGVWNPDSAKRPTEPDRRN